MFGKLILFDKCVSTACVYWLNLIRKRDDVSDDRFSFFAVILRGS